MQNSVHSRPDKLCDAETVLYEIDMLHFSKERLLKANSFTSDADEWIYLEAFLLHFRNLIEFFRGKSSHRDTLSISRPGEIWPNTRPNAKDLSFLVRPDLWTKYEDKDKPDKISKYLQHCTTQRVIKKKWDIAEMFNDLLPVMERFESLLPEYKPATKQRALRARPVAGHGQDAKSTASTRMVDLSTNLNPLRGEKP